MRSIPKTIVLALSICAPFPAAASTPTQIVPWSGCAQMAISKTRTAPYDAEDLKTLYCWLGLNNIDAGLEIARHYGRLTPPDHAAARKLLVDLAKAPKSTAAALRREGRWQAAVITRRVSMRTAASKRWAIAPQVPRLSASLPKCICSAKA